MVVIIPGILLLLGSAIALKMYPLYAGGGLYVADPSYVYLFNGLLLLEQQVPYHIDHPGTPLQSLIAILVYSQWTFLKLFESVNPDVVLAVMSDPERYLNFIGRALLFCNVAALIYLGKKIYDCTASLVLTALCQCSLLTYGIFATKLVYPAPEALVSCLSIWMLGLLVPIIFQASSVNEKRSAVAIKVGLIFGLGLATKLTFLPMALLLLLVGTWRHIGQATLAALVGWIVGVLPIITKLPDFWGWVTNMITHTGKYGGGSKGIVDVSQLSGNFHQLAAAFPSFYWILWVLVGSVIFFSGVHQLKYFSKTSLEKNKSRDYVHVIKVLTILISVCVLQTLIVLKHFGQHYMIPALPIAYVGLAVLLKSIPLPVTAWLRRATPIVCLGALLIFLSRSNYFAYQELRAERIQNNLALKQLQGVIKQYNNPIVIGSYGCLLPQCGLIFGVGYAPALEKKMAPFLSNFYGFNVWNALLIIDGRGFYPLNVLDPFFKMNRPVLLATQIEFPALDLFERELLLTVGDQKIYKIKGLIKPS